MPFTSVERRPEPSRGPEAGGPVDGDAVASGGGRRNYTMQRIARLVLTILFSHSAFPLRLSAAFGAVVAALAFAIGGADPAAGLSGAVQVEGWTSLVVVLSVFNGVTILMVSMPSEYIVRMLNQTSSREPYHIVEVVDDVGDSEDWRR